MSCEGRNTIPGSERCRQRYILTPTPSPPPPPPQWGAADAEIKVPCDENTELKGSPFKAWSRLVYGRAYYAYCQGFLPR